LLNLEFIPDREVEIYFKAADVLVLPYRNIYQSGILFLAWSFGLPVLASDVGSLKDELVEGRNGFVFKPEDSTDLASTIERYFKSDLYAHLDQRRNEIRNDATRRNSWDAAARTTMEVYTELLDSSLS
jgi:glycosyltransferase involved in cell wall biosynthesis